jgi:hypothetical protein
MFFGFLRSSGCGRLPLSAAGQFRLSAGVRKTGGGSIDGRSRRSFGRVLEPDCLQPKLMNCRSIPARGRPSSGRDRRPVSTYADADRVEDGYAGDGAGKTLR